MAMKSYMQKGCSRSNSKLRSRLGSWIPLNESWISPLKVITECIFKHEYRNGKLYLLKCMFVYNYRCKFYFKEHEIEKFVNKARHFYLQNYGMFYLNRQTSTDAKVPLSKSHPHIDLN